MAPTVPKPAPERAPKPGKQPAAKPAAASSSIPVADGEHVQVFKTMWDRKRKVCTIPVQKKGQAENCLSALRLLLICIIYAHGTISIYACQRESQVLWHLQPATDRHEFCIVCAGKWLVGSGVHPRHLATICGGELLSPGEGGGRAGHGRYFFEPPLTIYNTIPGRSYGC